MKAISSVELSGRLRYCGFKVINEIKRNGQSYILSIKSLRPSSDRKPSFRSIIALDRVGLYGKLIRIYKVRTMYPYSEFLQEQVYKNSHLSSNGKFSNDSRITPLGSLLRKYWIDEIPQFLNWLRGDIKVVGIRAMSKHYFSLYPQEYKDLFIKVKPGIIPPIFDERTTSFEDIINIEREYLESYLKNPIKTDIRYFWLTISQIIRGVRSK